MIVAQDTTSFFDGNLLLIIESKFSVAIIIGLLFAINAILFIDSNNLSLPISAPKSPLSIITTSLNSHILSAFFRPSEFSILETKR